MCGRGRSWCISSFEWLCTKEHFERRRRKRGKQSRRRRTRRKKTRFLQTAVSDFHLLLLLPALLCRVLWACSTSTLPFPTRPNQQSQTPPLFGSTPSFPSPLVPTLHPFAALASHSILKQRTTRPPPHSTASNSTAHPHTLLHHLQRDLRNPTWNGSQPRIARGGTRRRRVA